MFSENLWMYNTSLSLTLLMHVFFFSSFLSSFHFTSTANFLLYCHSTPMKPHTNCTVFFIYIQNGLYSILLHMQSLYSKSWFCIAGHRWMHWHWKWINKRAVLTSAKLMCPTYRLTTIKHALISLQIMSNCFFVKSKGWYWRNFLSPPQQAAKNHFNLYTCSYMSLMFTV